MFKPRGENPPGVSKHMATVGRSRLTTVQASASTSFTGTSPQVLSTSSADLTLGMGHFSNPGTPLLGQNQHREQMASANGYWLLWLPQHKVWS